jgi:16S rRNA (adenine1518-N6/adenine1519-N6)-dimethyltransferase
LTIIHGDALSLDFTPLLTPPVKIVSNLPYNVGTKILLNLITSESWPPFWDSLTFMFQNEVADRIVALPRTKAYGRLSIITQWRSEAKILFRVPASAFRPIPKVESAVVQVTPTKNLIFDATQKSLQTVVRLAFSQRRKMLRQSLKHIHPNIEKILNQTGINPESRPEELSIKEFCGLASALNLGK